MLHKALTDKFIVVGVDGMDPRLAKYLMDGGDMPNLKKLCELGSCREDLVLLGANPTVTPPMWTTLSTGAYPQTHGITGFFLQDKENLQYVLYGLDSRSCKAEPLWNVLAEQAHKNTLVWHWPGSSWPPTSQDEHLHVVEGTNPNAINAGVAECDDDKVIIASEEIKQVRYEVCSEFVPEGAGCILTDLQDTIAGEDDIVISSDRAVENDTKASLKGTKRIEIISTDIETYNEAFSMSKWLTDIVYSPVKAPNGWNFAIPEGAKEFFVVTSGGLVRRPCLILKNKEGIYDSVAIYSSKKGDGKPLTVVKKGELCFNFRDLVTKQDGSKVNATRHIKIMELADDGSQLKLWMSIALDEDNDTLFHPKSILQEIKEKVGPVPTAPRAVSGTNPDVVREIMIPVWGKYAEWQAKCLCTFMDEGKYDFIFSHLHNVDSIGHKIWHFAKDEALWEKHFDVVKKEKEYQEFMREVYVQTDAYIGQFLPYIEKGWSVILVSDHGFLTSEEVSTAIGMAGGISVPVMEELGYTVLKKDENGNPLAEVDWSKTTAVMSRGNDIWINLKGRQAQGIVDPKDKYALERKIIDDLYRYRYHGKPIVEFALQNRAAQVLGMGGPEFGDIIFCTAEGMNQGHCDALSTTYGYANTSVSPIFVAAGPGFKKGYQTERVIRQTDVAAILAVIAGVPLPAQCEGAPVRQIIDGDF